MILRIHALLGNAITTVDQTVVFVDVSLHAMLAESFIIESINHCAAVVTPIVNRKMTVLKR